MSDKRDAGRRMVKYERMTVAKASKRTTPEPMPASLSQPKSAGAVGAPMSKSGKSSSRTMHREGFTNNTGSVAPPYDCDGEAINDMGCESM